MVAPDPSISRITTGRPVTAVNPYTKTVAFGVALLYYLSYIQSWVDAQANLPVPGKVDRASECGSL